MPDIDASIPLQAHAPEGANVGQIVGNALTLRGLLQSQQLQQFQLQQAGIALQRQAAVRQAVSQNIDPTTGALDQGGVMRDLARSGYAGSPEANAALKDNAEIGKTQAEAIKTGVDTQSAQLDQASKKVNAAQSLFQLAESTGPQGWPHVRNNAVALGIPNVPDEYPGKDWLAGKAAELVPIKEQIDQRIAQQNANAGTSQAASAAEQAATARGGLLLSANTPTTDAQGNVINVDRTAVVRQALGGGQPPAQAPMQQVSGAEQALVDRANAMVKAGTPPAQVEQWLASEHAKLGAGQGVQTQVTPGPNAVPASPAPSGVGAMMSQPPSALGGVTTQVIAPADQVKLAAQKAAGTNYAEQLNTYQEEAKSLPQTLSQLNQLAKLAPDANIGPGSHAVGMLKGWANQIGIDMDPKTISANAAIDQIANRMILAARNSPDTKVAGAFTSAQQKLEAAGQIERTDPRAAFIAKVNALTDIVNREHAIASSAIDYAQKNGGTIDNGFYQNVIPKVTEGSMYRGSSGSAPSAAPASKDHSALWN